MKKENEQKRRWGFDQSFNVPFGQQLKSKREQLGISQQEIAERLKTSQVTISRIERAENNLSLTKIDKYVQALGIEITVKFPINERGKDDILCQQLKRSASNPPNISEFGIRIAKSIRDEKFFRAKDIKDSPSDKAIPNWKKSNSIISCNSVALYHELSLSN